MAIAPPPPAGQGAAIGAAAALGLCSGLMDGVKGQVLLLDRGFGFADNVVRLFSEREQRGLKILNPQDASLKEKR